MSTTLHTWEHLGAGHRRYAVPGGWLYLLDFPDVPVFVPDRNAPHVVAPPPPPPPPPWARKAPAPPPPKPEPTP